MTVFSALVDTFVGIFFPQFDRHSQLDTFHCLHSIFYTLADIFRDIPFYFWVFSFRNVIKRQIKDRMVFARFPCIVYITYVLYQPNVIQRKQTKSYQIVRIFSLQRCNNDSNLKITNIKSCARSVFFPPLCVVFISFPIFIIHCRLYVYLLFSFTLIKYNIDDFRLTLVATCTFRLLIECGLCEERCILQEFRLLFVVFYVWFQKEKFFFCSREKKVFSI